jgi:hypothetical protein
MHDPLISLVTASYSSAEAERHAGFMAAPAHLKDIGALGKEILQHVPVRPGACALMSALWTGLIRDRLDIPAYCVAGDLVVGGRKMFDAGKDPIASTFDQSNPAWDCHCWVAVGEWIGDVSLCRTAYSRYGPRGLRRHVLNQFGPGRGLLLLTTTAAANEGLSYIPRYVLGEPQVTGLMHGAATLFGPEEP